MEVQDAEDCGALLGEGRILLGVRDSDGYRDHLLLANMQLRQSDYTPVFEDYTACIDWANHLIGGCERAKHIDIHKHFAHEVVQNGHMRVYKIAKEFQLAKAQTKALQVRQFESYPHGLLEDAEEKGP